jgi:hypothetical protein
MSVALAKNPKKAKFICLILYIIHQKIVGRNKKQKNLFSAAR